MVRLGFAPASASRPSSSPSLDPFAVPGAGADAAPSAVDDAAPAADTTDEAESVDVAGDSELIDLTSDSAEAVAEDLVEVSACTQNRFGGER